MDWDKALSPLGNHYYINESLKDLSDNDIILGMIAAYRSEICTANHNCIDPAHLETDEYRYFRYPNGGSDHYNMRWVQEFCEAERPGLWERIFALKAFW
jgi:hypothetical protein